MQSQLSIVTNWIADVVIRWLVVLRRGRQAPLDLQAPFDGLEHQAIHQVSKRDDENHDRNDLAHVIKIASHHQELSQPKAYENHLARDQRSPRERPALFEARHDVRQTCRQRDMPEQLETSCSEVPS